MDESIRRRINVGEEYEVNYWARKLGVTPAELRKAANKVGEGLEDVRRELTRWKAA